MSDRIKRLRDEAQQKFLDWENVLGVGVAGVHDHEELVFLFKSESAKARKAIERWARKREVNCEFKVVHSVNSLS